MREKYENDVYRVDFKDYCSYDNESSATGLKTDRYSPFGSSGERYVSTYDAKLYVNKREGTSLRASQGDLSMPSNFKIFKLKDPPPPPKPDRKGSWLSSPSECCDGDGGSGSKESPIQPGNLIDLQMLIHEKLAHVKIRDLGNEIQLKSVFGEQTMSKKAALISLVRDHGTPEVEARSMLKKAATKPAMFYVKYADGFGGPNQSALQGGPTAPAFPAPQTGVEQMGYNSVSSQYPQEEFQEIPGMESARTDPRIYDPFYQPDQRAMQSAQEASQSGQKEIFDVSMLSGMLKSVGQDRLVDKNLGDLMKALDRLCRILFMFYWHQDDFQDRYGKAELPELEDGLRNSIEVLGDVVLWLMEKKVGGLDSLGLGSESGKGEPSIDEAARN
jgi:hypothetical protein